MVCTHTIPLWQVGASQRIQCIIEYLSQHWIHAVEWNHNMPKLGNTALLLFILAWNCYETLQLDGPSLAERQQCALNLLSIKLSYNCLKHQSNHLIKKNKWQICDLEENFVLFDIFSYILWKVQFIINALIYLDLNNFK